MDSEQMTGPVYKGVVRNRKKFRAQMQHNGVIYYSKSVETKEEAAHAYDTLARKFLGELALTNYDLSGNRILSAFQQTQK